MSTATVNIATPGQPSVVSLPTAHLACRSCGVAVPISGGDVERVQIGSHWEPIPGTSPIEQRVVTDYLELGRCERCALIRSEAARVVDEHRVLLRQLGGVVIDRVEGALLALDLLGAELPKLRSVAEVVQLVTLVHGAGIAFEAQLRFGVCASGQWAHVPDEARAALRDCAARWMPLGPPIDSERRGCMLCGVDRSGTWEALTASAHSLGSTVRAGWMEPIEGDACAACADAISYAGAVGQTALKRALQQHLGVAHTFASDAVEMAIRGWGGLPNGTRANRSPWAHLDLDAIRRDLREIAGVR